MKILFKSQKLEKMNQIEAKQHPERELSESFFRDLMDNQLSRGYLGELGDPKSWKLPVIAVYPSIQWLRVDRLPLAPGKDSEHTLMDCWQSALSACHAMQVSIAMVLLRCGGKTNLFFGTQEKYKNQDKIRNALAAHMQGIDLHKCTATETDLIENHFLNFGHSGAVTGFPSSRLERIDGQLQTLDKLAGGLRINGKEQNYAFVLIADPANDAEITQLQQILFQLKSEIHTLLRYNESFNKGENGSVNIGANANIPIGGKTEKLAAGAMMAAGLPPVSGGPKPQLRLNYGRSWGYSVGDSVSRETIDFTGQYCENLIDKNIARLEKGRNLGFWNTGVYLLASNDDTVDAALGILRSIYSGRETYVEPIRIINTSGSGAVDYISHMMQVPLPKDPEVLSFLKELNGDGEHWHVLGRMYESLTTPMTTEELSITGSLPNRETNGLLVTRTACHFTSNPNMNQGRSIQLGSLVDMGVILDNLAYRMRVDAMVRHVLLTGKPGEGKSTTSQKIITKLMEMGIPVLIIEPAKDDYVRWAIEQNRSLPKDKQIRIIMPGIDSIDGVVPEPLRLCPFQPAAWKDSSVNLLKHSENLTSLLCSALAATDVVPILIEETVNQCIEVAAEEYDQDLSNASNRQLDIYPGMYNLAAEGQNIMAAKTYANDVKRNFTEILGTRFKKLQRGTIGSILNNVLPVDYDALFNQPTVINLSQLASGADQALVMSLLLLAVYEYRESIYRYNDAYRGAARNNELQHLLVIEEAHTLLSKPDDLASGAQRQTANLFSRMIREVRQLGQGLMIVDQTPTALIEDVVKNTNYKITHRLASADDMQAMAAAMALRPDQTEILPELEIGNAIISSDQDRGAAWVKVSR